MIEACPANTKKAVSLKRLPIQKDPQTHKSLIKRKTPCHAESDTAALRQIRPCPIHWASLGKSLRAVGDRGTVALLSLKAPKKLKIIPKAFFLLLRIHQN